MQHLRLSRDRNNYGPKNSIVLIIGTSKKVPLILGIPMYSTGLVESRIFGTRGFSSANQESIFFDGC